MKKKYLLGALNILLAISITRISIIPLYYLKIINLKYLIIFIITLCLFTILTIKNYLSTNKNTYNITQFISIIINIICIFNIYKIETTYSYYSNIFTKKYTYQQYNIYILRKNTTYSNISKIQNKTIGILDYNNSNTKDYLDNTIKINKKVYSNVSELEEALESGKIQCFMISNNYQKDINSKKLKRIYTTQIKEENI